MTVDEFVENNILPELRGVAETIRRFMRELAPQVEEVFSYNMPCYKGRHIFAWISPAKTHITFGFSHGRQFEDKYLLLKGVGRGSKHLKFKRVEDVNKDVLAYYLEQALAWDSK